MKVRTTPKPLVVLPTRFSNVPVCDLQCYLLLQGRKTNDLLFEHSLIDISNRLPQFNETIVTTSLHQYPDKAIVMFPTNLNTKAIASFDVIVNKLTQKQLCIYIRCQMGLMCLFPSSLMPIGSLRHQIQDKVSLIGVFVTQQLVRAVQEGQQEKPCGTLL